MFCRLINISQDNRKDLDVRDVWQWFLMQAEKIEMLLQVDWEEYYSHYLVDLLGLDQVRYKIGVKNVKILTTIKNDFTTTKK